MLVVANVFGNVRLLAYCKLPISGTLAKR